MAGLTTSKCFDSINSSDMFNLLSKFILNKELRVKFDNYFITKLYELKLKDIISRINTPEFNDYIQYNYIEEYKYYENKFLDLFILGVEIFNTYKTNLIHNIINYNYMIYNLNEELKFFNIPYHLFNEVYKEYIMASVPIEHPAPPVEHPAPPVEHPARPVEHPARPVEHPAPAMFTFSLPSIPADKMIVARPIEHSAPAMFLRPPAGLEKCSCNVPQAPMNTNKPAFSFGRQPQDPLFSFGSATQEPQASQAPRAEPAFSFGRQPQEPLFSFGLPSQEPQASQAPRAEPAFRFFNPLHTPQAPQLPQVPQAPQVPKCLNHT